MLYATVAISDKEFHMGKSIFIITAVVVLFVSGFAFAHMMGKGGSCCSMHQMQH
jgi:hypothetical protein